MSKVYQLKITLKEVKPPIWRRIEVPANTKLTDLKRQILRAMGWGGGHLSSFEFDREEYMDDTAFMSQELGLDGLPMSKTRLNQVLTAEKQKGIFCYDFGDGWEHVVLLEKILDAEKGVTYPRCTAGKRACPPDDCGGPWGYADFLEAIKDPKHPEHEDMLEWVGGAFDAEAFDLERVNEGL